MTARTPKAGEGPLAGAVRALARPGGPTRALLGGALLAGAVYAAFGGPFINLIGQSCAVFAIAALGQSILMGSAGQVAFSGGAFMAIGAFTTGMLSGTPLEPFPIPLVAGALIGWAVGLVSGLPGLRFRGLYLLLASLALQFIVLSLAHTYQSAHHPAGVLVPPLRLGPLDLSSGRALYFTLLAVLAVVYAAAWAVERTGVGLAWRALRESEVAAAVSGVDVTRWKLYAFAASGAVTAMAGSLFAYLVGRADYQSYELALSISLITMIFIGGIRSRLGALAGAVVITTLPYLLQNNLSVWLGGLGLDAGWYAANQSQVNAGLFSLLFLLVVLFEPHGVEGILLKAERAVRARSRHRTAGGAS
ncbi:branched-chain amino acid ABC transporter permease [Actinocorallia populi]|uniref:branched-chain amino acid ABC transporter permease n=1 Tax=Actinocorallia populi TaxID=2079200 RepID=UPI000D093CFE|nr:branched-chain amino acid ABC transporter permease [Actinocorallia populi]